MAIPGIQELRREEGEEIQALEINQDQAQEQEALRGWEEVNHEDAYRAEGWDIVDHAAIEEDHMPPENYDRFYTNMAAKLQADMNSRRVLFGKHQSMRAMIDAANKVAETFLEYEQKAAAGEHPDQADGWIEKKSAHGSSVCSNEL